MIPLFVSHRPKRRILFLILFRVVLRRRLGGQFQRRRDIVPGHVQLYKLQIWRRTEVLVREESLDFFFRLNLVGLVLSTLCPKRGYQVLVIPLLDIIVSRIPAMYTSLDRVTIIANNKDDQIQLVSDHGADFLGC